MDLGNSSRRGTGRLEKSCGDYPRFAILQLRGGSYAPVRRISIWIGAALLQNGQPVAYASRALTGAETRYAQIEKELLAIVFACERFEPYVYGRDDGRDIVHVETDHEPLEPIFVKELNAAPKRLQQMLLRLQKYNLCVACKKGPDMYLADTLSRAFLPEVNACEFTQELESVDHRAFLPVSNKRWQQIKHPSADDPELQKLRAIRYVKDGQNKDLTFLNVSTCTST